MFIIKLYSFTLTHVFTFIKRLGTYICLIVLIDWGQDGVGLPVVGWCVLEYRYELALITAGPRFRHLTKSVS